MTENQQVDSTEAPEMPLSALAAHQEPPHSLPAPSQMMPGTPGIYEIAGIDLDEIVDNKPALKLLIHSYRITVDENVKLTQQQSFDKAEIKRIEQEKHEVMHDATKDNWSKRAGSLLLLFGSVPIGIGGNLITNGSANSVPGIMVLASGILISLVGCIFSFGFDVFSFWKRKDS